MLEVSAEKGATTDHIETLIELHEYEAYYKNNNDKSLEYLITAIDLADNHKINLLRLKARSKLIYFHQSTTQDQELVSDILKEMNAINELEKSEFYNRINNQWEAQIIGTKQLIGLSTTDSELQQAYATLLETKDTFDPNDREEIFYYQQARRSLVGFFSARIGYDTGLQYFEELNALSSKMKDPITKITNLVFEGAFYIQFERFNQLIERFTEERELLLNANHGIASYYHQLLAAAYEATGDLENALLSTKKQHEHESAVNKVAFQNKVISIRREQESQNYKFKNTALRSTNTLLYALASLLLLGIAGIYYTNRKVKQQRKTIEEQRNNLNQANVIKNKLLGLLSHDLNAPITNLANISGKVEFLVKNEEWDMLAEMTSEINDKTNIMKNVLDNILIWSKTQLKNTDLPLSKVNLSALLQNVTIELDHEMRKKDIHLNFPTTNNHEVVAHKDALEIVVRNIIRNAIKYSHHSGMITISCSTKSDQLTLNIADNGVGIESKDLLSLFDDFKSTLGTDDEKGYGLGLKISRDILHAMNNDISISSKKNEGTKVNLFLRSN